MPNLLDFARPDRTLLARATMAALALLALLAAGASAQPLEEGLARVCAGELQRFRLPAFTRFDQNGDRRISAEEAERCAILEALFRRLDLDADDVLSLTEYQALNDVWRRRARALEDPEPS